MPSHVESREGIEAIRTLVLGLTVREAGECAGLPPVRGPLVRVDRRRDLPRDHGHHLFADASSEVEPGLKVLR